MRRPHSTRAHGASSDASHPAVAGHLAASGHPAVIPGGVFGSAAPVRSAASDPPPGHTSSRIAPPGFGPGQASQVPGTSESPGTSGSPGASGSRDVSESGARALALRFLDRQARTCSELLAHLLKRGVPRELADSLVGRFEETGLLDDQRLAENWVLSRQTRKSAQQLRAELVRRGIERDVAAAAAGAVGEDVEEAAMLKQAVARAARMGNLPTGVKQRRLMAQLARRGYPADAARRCVEQALARSDGPASERGLPAEPAEPLERDFLDQV